MVKLLFSVDGFIEWSALKVIAILHLCTKISKHSLYIIREVEREQSITQETCFIFGFFLYFADNRKELKQYLISQGSTI